MIRIEVEVETDDPALRDYVLGDVESWRRTGATVSVAVREEDVWSGGARTVRLSASSSMSVGAAVERSVEEEPPPTPVHMAPPRLTTITDARAEADFPVFVVPTLTAASPPQALVQPGGADVPSSVVVTYGVTDGRGRHRGNVWVTSSATPLPTSRFDSWQTVGDYDVCEDRSGGFYRCKIRSQQGATYVQVETTAHRNLDEVLDLAAAVRAE